jgi:PAS domain S-box-containing protein
MSADTKASDDLPCRRTPWRRETPGAHVDRVALTGLLLILAAYAVSRLVAAPSVWSLGHVGAVALLTVPGRRLLQRTNRLQLRLQAERNRLERRVASRTDALRQSEAEARAIFESSMDAIIVADEHGVIVEFNSVAEETFGVWREAAIGTSVRETILPSDLRDWNDAAWSDLDDSGVSKILGRRLRAPAMRRNGEEFSAEISIVRVAGAGRPLLWACVRDVTAEIKREEDLRKAEEQSRQRRVLLDAVVNNIPASVFWKDRESRYLGCNATFAHTAGLKSPEDVVGLVDFDLPWSREQSEGYRSYDKKIMASGIPEYLFEEEMRTADGSHQVVLTSKVPLRDSEGNVCGVLGICSDITERKSLETRLAQSQKLESLGQLAAGVAHEINTPMQSVASNVEFLQKSYGKLITLFDQYIECLSCPAKSWDERRKMLEEASQAARVERIRKETPLAIEETAEAVQRVIEIVRAMKSMAHPGMGSKKATDVNQLLRTAATVSRNEWKYVAELALELDGSAPKTQLLATEMSQVFVNLLMNAVDAIKERFPEATHVDGRIVCRTRILGPYVCVEIEDNGAGVPDAIRNRVFDPFFTTKDVGKGSGQGLAISYDVVVNRHRGRISFDSVVGRGTRFTILLPAVERARPTESELSEIQSDLTLLAGAKA